jgi:hypothetical protein
MWLSEAAPKVALPKWLTLPQREFKPKREAPISQYGKPRAHHIARLKLPKEALRAKRFDSR